MILSLLERVNYNTHKITLLTTSPAVFSANIESAGIPVEVLPFPADYGQSSYRCYRALKRSLNDLKAFSVIFVQGTFFDFTLADFLAGYVATKGNIFSYEVLAAPEPPAKSSSRHLGVVPGIGLWWYQQRVVNALPGFLLKRVVTVGKEIERRLIEWYHYPKRVVNTVYHGTDLEVFRPDELVRRKMRAAFGISPTENVILSTARLSSVKRLDRLINAFDIVAEDYPQIRLIILGDGPLRDQLESLAKSKKTCTKIMFLGLKVDVTSYLRMSDVFVLSSENEGLSNAMLEAMATGLVCVVTRTPGAAEVIEDGDTGFIVEKSEDGLCKGLLKALSLSPERKACMGRNAREVIKAQFDIRSGAIEEMRLLGICD
jgi:glycosyltransferase involved in cell wall biosynthesis